MPSSWLRLGVDFDGDGRIDLNTIPDALGSTAHFLKQRGKWQSDLVWGYEVKATADFDNDLADNRTIRRAKDWERLGLMPAGDVSRIRPDTESKVTFPAGFSGPGFALTNNFKAFLAYNNAFSYALAVGLLAEQLRGSNGLVTPWPGAERQLSTVELQETQRRLTASGFDTGGTDGRVGDLTRQAVRAYQQRHKLLPADGYPNETILKRLRLEGG